MRRTNFLLVLLGSVSLLSYLAAAGLHDLRQHTLEFEVAFVAAFVIYLVSAVLVLRMKGRPGARSTLLIIFAFAVLFRLVLLPTKPTLSDDMFRYVWDGRVQAHGISPYRYPPDAIELTSLRRDDQAVWPNINRQSVVTVYPPGAQLAYATIWRIVGDSVVGFKAVFVLAELLGAVLLMRLLRVFNQPKERVLLYLWSPLLVYEVAHAGHVDGLMLPLLIGAWLARANQRTWSIGILLGAATLIKLFPALLLPALLPLPRPWSVKGLRPAVETSLGFGAIIAAAYFFYALGGANPIGFLPQYFDENFNMGLAHAFFQIARPLSLPGSTLVNLITFGGLAVLSIAFVARPAVSAKEAILRCVWLIGWFTLTTQNLFAWYLLWLLPLIVLFVEPGRFLGLRLSAMSAWLIFSGLIGLSYVFFVQWKPYPWMQTLEFVPLYLVLLAAGAIFLWSRRTSSQFFGHWFPHDEQSKTAA